MWSRTGILRTGYHALYPFKKHFRCAQAQHFLVFCWLMVALIRAPGKGTLKGLQPYLPSQLNIRMSSNVDSVHHHGDSYRVR
jgi:hypothetical protein